MKRLPVSVIVPTKNEEAAIAGCLKGLGDFDQIFVVDSNSTDDTLKIAALHGAEVFTHNWDGRYPKKKQWCLENLPLKHDWVLFIDADERPTDHLVKDIGDTLSGPLAAYGAFDIELDYYFLGRRLQHGHRVTKRVLVHRRRAKFPEIGDLDAPGMNEQEGHYQPQVTGQIGRLRGRIEHEDRDPFRTWLDRHNRYSDWEAYLVANPSVQGQVAAVRNPRASSVGNPLAKALVFFFYSYVAKAGWLDGRAGFHYALANSFYYWQIAVKTYETAERAKTKRDSS